METDAFVKKLLENSKKFVGLVEVRDNSKWDNPDTKGPDQILNDLLVSYLKKVSWWDLGSAYCAAYGGGMVIMTADGFNMDSSAFRAQWTAHCMTNVQRMAKLGYLSKTPKKGSLWLAQHNNTNSGHAGIVNDVIDSDEMETFEGNTSDDNHGDQREGDGLFEKERNIYLNGSLKTKGFVHPENIIKLLKSKSVIPVSIKVVYVRVQTYLEAKNLHHLVDEAVQQKWCRYDKELKYSVASVTDINKWLKTLK